MSTTLKAIFHTLVFTLPAFGIFYAFSPLSPWIKLILECYVLAVVFFNLNPYLSELRRHLWFKILVSLLLGIILGDLLEERAVYLKPVAEIFLRLIKMLVVPLIFSSMIVGITSVHDPKKLGRVGIKSLFLYVMTTFVSVLIGLGFAYLLKPGEGMSRVYANNPSLLSQNSPLSGQQEAKSISQLIIDVVPVNPVESLANGEVLQIIVFALFLGVSIMFIGQRGRPLLRVMESLSDTMYRLTGIVMEFAPIGVCAIMADVTGEYGFDVLKKLMYVLICNYLACIFQVLLVFSAILYFFGRLNPMRFFKGMSDAAALAFSTGSSSGTLPVSLHCAQENLGVSKNITSFVLPLGATVNMNGAAIGQAIGAVFVAQAYGIVLSWETLLIILVTVTLGSIGAAGIPSSGIFMLPVVLGSAGLPVEGAAALLYSIDRIREMASTVVNILGDAVVAVYVAKTEGELDEDQYNHAELIEMDDSDI